MHHVGFNLTLNLYLVHFKQSFFEVICALGFYDALSFYQLWARGEDLIPESENLGFLLISWTLSTKKTFFISKSHTGFCQLHSSASSSSVTDWTVAWRGAEQLSLALDNTQGRALLGCTREVCTQGAPRLLSAVSAGSGQCCYGELQCWDGCSSESLGTEQLWEMFLVEVQTGEQVKWIWYSDGFLEAFLGSGRVVSSMFLCYCCDTHRKHKFRCFNKCSCSAPYKNTGIHWSGTEYLCYIRTYRM